MSSILSGLSYLMVGAGLQYNSIFCRTNSAIIRRSSSCDSPSKPTEQSLTCNKYHQFGGLFSTVSSDSREVILQISVLLMDIPSCKGPT